MDMMMGGAIMIGTFHAARAAQHFISPVCAASFELPYLVGICV
jgi:hypothetical protein